MTADELAQVAAFLRALAAAATETGIVVDGLTGTLERVDIDGGPHRLPVELRRADGEYFVVAVDGASWW